MAAGEWLQGSGCRGVAAGEWLQGSGCRGVAAGEWCETSLALLCHSLFLSCPSRPPPLPSRCITFYMLPPSYSLRVEGQTEQTCGQWAWSLTSCEPMLGEVLVSAGVSVPPPPLPLAPGCLARLPSRERKQCTQWHRSWTPRPTLTGSSSQLRLRTSLNSC